MPGVYTTSKDDTRNTCILTLLSLKNAPIFPQPHPPVHLVKISEGITYGTVSKYTHSLSTTNISRSSAGRFSSAVRVAKGMSLHSSARLARARSRIFLTHLPYLRPAQGVYLLPGGVTLGVESIFIHIPSAYHAMEKK